MTLKEFSFSVLLTATLLVLGFPAMLCAAVGLAYLPTH